MTLAMAVSCLMINDGSLWLPTITQAAQVKCFPLSQEQLLISGPCLQKPSPTSPSSFFLSPLPPPPPLLLHPPPPISLLPEGLLFTAECLLLSARCDRTQQQTGLIVEGRRGGGGGRLWGYHSHGFHCGTVQT